MTLTRANIYGSPLPGATYKKGRFTVTDLHDLTSHLVRQLLNLSPFPFGACPYILPASYQHLVISSSNLQFFHSHKTVIS